MMPSRLKHENGSVLIQVMTAVAVSFLVIMLITSVTVAMSKAAASSQLKLTLFELRNTILSTLLTDGAWTKTLAHADNKGDPKEVCLSGTNGDAAPPIDCSNSGASLTVVDSGGTVVLKKDSPTLGYTARGIGCNTFTAPPGGDPQCPVYISARWETDCSSPCTSRAPPLKILIKFLVTEVPGTPIINSNNLDFSLRR